LLTLCAERARPGDNGLTRAAARVIAFGNLLEDTAVWARPFDACVRAKAKVVMGEVRDAPAAARVAHALGLHALCERLGQPIDLRKTRDRRLVRIGDRQIAYHAPSNGVARFSGVLFLYEPGLWRWMTGFRPDDVLLDIGANVGIYTIAAAGLFGVRVAALEPYGPNLEALRRNVTINRLADRVAVLPVAATDVERSGRLYHEGGEAGAAAQHFETTEDGSDGTDAFDRVEGVPVDVLVERGTIPFPTRIKIDVDGNERAVIEGMTRTLADPRLHSIRLEVRWHLPEGRAVVERVESFGFRAAIDDDAKNLLFTRVKIPSKSG
jgi:FkbM family methyltransferase